MNKRSTLWIVLGSIAFVCLCLGVLGVSSFQSTQVTLLTNQQAVQRGKAQYSGALDIVTQKITGAFDLADRQIAHEDRAYKVLADARSAYNKALSSGTPVDQVQAAQGFSLAFQALAESNPEFASAGVVQGAMNAMEEAVNEVFTAFQDWQDNVQAYNTYRGKLFMPLIVGNMLGYPSSYEYYEGAAEKLDIQKLIPTQTGP